MFQRKGCAVEDRLVSRVEYEYEFQVLLLIFVQFCQTRPISKKEVKQERKRHTTHTASHPGRDWGREGYPCLGRGWEGEGREGTPVLVWGTPSPPLCGRTNKVKTLPFLVLRTRAVHIITCWGNSTQF